MGILLVIFEYIITLKTSNFLRKNKRNIILLLFIILFIIFIFLIVLILLQYILWLMNIKLLWGRITGFFELFVDKPKGVYLPCVFYTIFKCLLLLILAIMIEIVLYISVFLRCLIAEKYLNHNSKNMIIPKELQQLYPYYLWRIFIQEAIMKQSPFDFFIPILGIFLIPALLIIIIPSPISDFYDSINFAMIILWLSSLYKLLKILYMTDQEFQYEPEKDNIFQQFSMNTIKSRKKT